MSLDSVQRYNPRYFGGDYTHHGYIYPDIAIDTKKMIDRDGKLQPAYTPFLSVISFGGGGDKAVKPYDIVGLAKQVGIWHHSYLVVGYIGPDGEKVILGALNKNGYSARKEAVFVEGKWEKALPWKEMGRNEAYDYSLSVSPAEPKHAKAADIKGEHNCTRSIEALFSNSEQQVRHSTRQVTWDEALKVLAEANKFYQWYREQDKSLVLPSWVTTYQPVEPTADKLVFKHQSNELLLEATRKRMEMMRDKAAAYADKMEYSAEKKKLFISQMLLEKVGPDAINAAIHLRLRQAQFNQYDEHAAKTTHHKKKPDYMSLPDYGKKIVEHLNAVKRIWQPYDSSFDPKTTAEKQLKDPNFLKGDRFSAMHKIAEHYNQPETAAELGKDYVKAKGLVTEMLANYYGSRYNDTDKLKLEIIKKREKITANSPLDKFLGEVEKIAGESHNVTCLSDDVKPLMRAAIEAYYKSRSLAGVIQRYKQLLSGSDKKIDDKYIEFLREGEKGEQNFGDAMFKFLSQYRIDCNEAQGLEKKIIQACEREMRIFKQAILRERTPLNFEAEDCPYPAGFQQQGSNDCRRAAVELAEQALGINLFPDIGDTSEIPLSREAKFKGHEFQITRDCIDSVMPIAKFRHWMNAAQFEAWQYLFDLERQDILTRDWDDTMAISDACHQLRVNMPSAMPNDDGILEPEGYLPLRKIIEDNKRLRNLLLGDKKIEALMRQDDLIREYLSHCKKLRSQSKDKSFKTWSDDLIVNADAFLAKHPECVEGVVNLLECAVKVTAKGGQTENNLNACKDAMITLQKTPGSHAVLMSFSFLAAVAFGSAAAIVAVPAIAGTLAVAALFVAANAVREARQITPELNYNEDTAQLSTHVNGLTT